MGRPGMRVEAKDKRCFTGAPSEHVLIWHIDTQGLARRGLSASDELHRLLSLHGRVAALEVYLHLSAAAVSFARTQDAQKVRHSFMDPCSCAVKNGS